MAEDQLNVIVSMIIQNLRLSKHNELIDLIKAAECSMEWKDHDNWNGGIDFYDLVFRLSYKDYTRIYDKKDLYQDILGAALNSFYRDETNIIQNVLLVTKIEQYVDWDALDATENKESILERLDKEKNILIQVGTGKLRIQDTNPQYIDDHQKLCDLLKKLCLCNPNPYEDLWDWYNDYNERKLSTYQSRRTYIRELYSLTISIIQNSEIHSQSLTQYVPIGWEKVDNAISKMKDILVNASITEDYQSVGMYGREVLISLAQLVFKKDKHPSVDGTEIGNSDSKRMLEAYINYCLHYKSNPREIKFAKATIDFANELTHNRTANSMDAELCYNAVATAINIVRTIEKYN